MSELSHVDESSGAVHMVDVGHKPVSHRIAIARGAVLMAPETARRLRDLPKGDALATAQAVRETMAEISKKFPPGITYDIIYDPTQFIQQSVDDLLKEMKEADVLGVIMGRQAPKPLGIIPNDEITEVMQQHPSRFVAFTGIDLRDIDRLAWAQSVSFVAQDAQLFTGTVAENIRYARPEASEAEVKAAAQAAQAGFFLSVHHDSVQPHLLQPCGQECFEA